MFGHTRLKAYGIAKSCVMQGLCTSLLVANIVARGGAITIQFDYTYDGQNGFFSVPQRREALEAAADYFEQLLTDSLSAIVPAPDNQWIARFPTFGAGGWTFVPNLTVPADTLVVYAAGKDLPHKLRGRGGPGKADVAGDDQWVQTVTNRGQLNANGPGATDFGPWGGSITFDTTTPDGTPRDWNFDASVDSSGDQDDFLTAALHELGHVLGLGSSDSWRTWVDGDNNKFMGPKTTAQFDGPVELDTAFSTLHVHWKEGTTSTVYPDGDPQTAVMVPRIAEWRSFTALDVAALRDVGWQIATTRPALQPGDANQDYSFDSLDIIQVLRAEKYRTSSLATWGDGDWNGTPGEETRTPPVGDGLFDQFDIITAQKGAIYLTGAYAAFQPNTEENVRRIQIPEPSTALLLGLGALTLGLLSTQKTFGERWAQRSDASRNAT